MAYSSSYSSNGVTNALHVAADAIKRAFASIGHAMVLNSSANRRLQQVETLSAKTDAELAEMGLKREDIARYVFRDILFL